jgi:hypothetical protein
MSAWPKTTHGNPITTRANKTTACDYSLWLVNKDAAAVGVSERTARRRYANPAFRKQMAALRQEWIEACRTAQQGAGVTASCPT